MTQFLLFTAVAIFSRKAKYDAVLHLYAQQFNPVLHTVEYVPSDF